MLRQLLSCIVVKQRPYVVSVLCRTVLVKESWATDSVI